MSIYSQNPFSIDRLRLLAPAFAVPIALTIATVTPSVAQTTRSIAQTIPSRTDFAQALAPAPRVLQHGHQGLPIIGGAPRADATPTRSAGAWETVSRYDEAAAGRVRIRRVAAVPAKAAPRCADASTEASEGKPMIGFRIEFEFASAQLKPQSIEILRNLGAALNEDLTDQKQFELQGHTDAVGSLEYNEQLSKLRAEAVRDFLVNEMKVSPERLVTTGRGFCELANPSHPYAAENRRVVVINQSL